MLHVKQFPSFIDSRGKIFRKIIEAEEGDLAGQAVSAGVVRGKAKGCRSDIYNGVNNLQAHYRWYVTDCF